MGKFQLITIIIFIILSILGLLLFAGAIEVPWRQGDDNTGRNGSIELTVWGTLDESDIRTILLSFSKSTKDKYALTYVEKNQERFELDLLRAITDGGGPDIVLFTDGLLPTIENKLIVTPYSSFSERAFREIFIEGAEILLHPDGILAMPVAIDPLVMYWNRDIFNDERLTHVPTTWDKVRAFASDITIKDERGKIKRSAIAFGGTSDNVKNAKEIISMLFLQAGNGITARNDKAKIIPLINYGKNDVAGLKSAGSALIYYVGFADPEQRHYSWNSSLINSVDMFSSGDLALYFGLASDKNIIDRLNPHLNYDIAKVPQLSVRDRDLTFGHIYSLGVLSTSKNLSGALGAVYEFAISDDRTQKMLSEQFFLPPAKRILLAEDANNPYMTTFYSEAIISKTWLDPDPSATNEIFDVMARDVLSNKRSAEGALREASDRIDNLTKGQ